MRAIHHDPDALVAEATLLALARSLHKSHLGAADSLREGLAETKLTHRNCLTQCDNAEVAADRSGRHRRSTELGTSSHYLVGERSPNRIRGGRSVLLHDVVDKKYTGGCRAGGVGARLDP